MPNNYELMLVLAPDLKDDQVAGLKGQIVDEMTGLGAEIVNQEDWGKRELAFEVRDYFQGYYHLYQFEAPGDMPGKLKVLLKVNEKVIRYILTTWVPKAKPFSAKEPGAKEPELLKPEDKKTEEPKQEVKEIDVPEQETKQPDVPEQEAKQPDAEPEEPKAETKAETKTETEKAEEDTDITE